MANGSLPTDQQYLALRQPPKAANISVVGLIPQPGEWLAAYSLMRIGKGDGPTIVDVCKISDLVGPQRKRADLWLSAFGRFVEAAAPMNAPA
jgi:hypothetical protein